MREIKFRWLHKKSGKFASWERLLKECDRLSFLIPCDDWVIMQYTGLKDKNGVEIYEGDIVIGLRDGTLDYSKQRAIIEFKGGAFRENYFNRSVGDYINCSYGYGNILEVIGNIYENPGLLQGEKNES